MPVVSRLESLPVELLHDIHLLALNHALPCSSKHLYQVFKWATPTCIAQYIVFRTNYPKEDESYTITKALRYPVCNQNVIEALFRLLSFGKVQQQTVKCKLPKRLFRNLKSESGVQQDNGDPLPFLRCLYATPGLSPDPNSHQGYALSRAVHARHGPLIQFLLDQGASPSCGYGLSVMFAIKQKDLCLVRMLIEAEEKSSGKGTGKNKERRLSNNTMLTLALRCDARDIAEYFTRERGIVPELKPLLEIGGR
ncbi:hypothetical protein M378DRAFT_259043 [Amanita muscaria Koide BX008]|uniref:Ankyrin repeat protein n=1 Tax=Amanita muscaria (strain Koide BX008) TaxID=946122 RepID=A0A0C2XF92_AMAMK|nr:hypothetical protein M378DRAFT_259043 [Amanita muscaria Koide BX008]